MSIIGQTFKAEQVCHHTWDEYPITTKDAERTSALYLISFASGRQVYILYTNQFCRPTHIKGKKKIKWNPWLMVSMREKVYDDLFYFSSVSFLDPPQKKKEWDMTLFTLISWMWYGSLGTRGSMIYNPSFFPFFFFFNILVQQRIFSIHLFFSYSNFLAILFYFPFFFKGKEDAPCASLLSD